MSKVNDRGTIKWTSLMLPEQQQILEKMWSEQNKKEKPILDKQELEILDKKMQIAIHEDVPVSITYFSDGEYEIKKGKLKQVNGLEEYLQLDDLTKIKLKDVLDVETEN